MMINNNASRSILGHFDSDGDGLGTVVNSDRSDTDADHISDGDIRPIYSTPAH